MTIQRTEAYVAAWSTENGQEVACLQFPGILGHDSSFMVPASTVVEHGVPFGEAKTAVLKAEVDLGCVPPEIVLTSFVGYLPTLAEAIEELNKHFR